MTNENKPFADGFEIPDELLEQITGGMDPEVENALWNAVSVLKENGATLKRTLEIFENTVALELREEALDFIKQNWDLI